MISMPIDARSFVAFFAAASLSLVTFAADPTPAAKREIEQLLSRLAASGCQFQRNGSWHDGPEARAHIERKYRYVLERHMVATTEDFISQAATESSMSGKAYAVKCPNQQELPSAKWMEAQLKVLRGSKQAAQPKTP
ncbi:MAG: hypothetical protein JWQ07_1266 [Ramlibacter sp.]|nr:hypothetical protein [Ramlibacter sp.]